ncbi:MAG: cobalamin biosynthesis protein [Clostridium argentinense]|uniref:Cobalamin biosynthesis protein CobD n=1 Tax=Clostridium faecium TaxID=2762223 RepID=A0ABR8YSW1_9CLOT|nr:MULTISPECIES: adenosylcobinamide-phosphate synthase CbiB [Clostridium]MBD8047341.1 cobalamin biosynthesis protein [Clostridium faecium]MBS5823913.1 cobalamin biosynthesis protein [Clostridium argentinense]MDU1350279.1 adenosylcobinamide-phosphate synthase CbiB [Clostridium argentinense]
MFNFNLKANIIYVLIAMIIDFLLGDPSWLPHPIIYIGKLISKLESYFRKGEKSDEGLRICGGLIVLIVCFVTYIIPYILLKLSLINIYLFHGLNIFIIWTTLAANSLHKAAIEVYKSLERKDIEDARVKLSYIVGRDTKNLEEDEIIRADIETVAENSSDGIIAPIFYAILGGAPLAMMYKGVNTMDSMLGYLNKKYKFIGFFPAKVDDLFNLIPARLTGILMCLTSFVVGGTIEDSFRIMIRDRKNHKSPNCAYPEAAAAGAMKIQLGGTNTYFGELVYKPTLGDRIKSLEASDIKQSIKLMYSSEILLVLISLILVIM